MKRLFRGLGVAAALASFSTSIVLAISSVPPGALVWLQGYDLNPISPAFRNEGTVKLECIDDAIEVALVVDGEGLDNAPGGLLLFSQGAGGSRAFQGRLANHGTVRVGYGTVFVGAGTRVENEGTFSISSQARIQFLGPEALFEQRAGSLDCGYGVEMRNGTFRYLGGSVTGVVTLIQSSAAIAPEAPGALNLVSMGEFGGLSGRLSAEQSLAVAGSLDFGTGRVQVATGTRIAGRMELTSTNAAVPSELVLEPGSEFETSARLEVTSGWGGARAMSGVERWRGAMSVRVPFDVQVRTALTNDGTVDIRGEGTLRLDGGFVQTPQGALTAGLSLAGPGGLQPVVSAVGDIQLDGRIGFDLAAGETLVAGSQFLLLEAANVRGMAQFDLPVLPPGLHWDLALEKGRLWARVRATGKPFRLAIRTTQDGVTRFSVVDTPASGIEIESSPDLVRWSRVPGHLEFSDGQVWLGILSSDAPSGGRFYRARRAE